MITLFGICFVALATVLLIWKRGDALPWVLAVAGAFPATMVAAVGSNGISPFYFVALAIMGLLAISALRSESPTFTGKRPGRRALLAFVVYALVVTAVSPNLFAGIPVLSARGGVDAELQMPSALGYSVSNLAQSAYLILAVGIVFFFSRLRVVSPGLPAVMFGVGTVLSASRMVVGGAWPTQFFSNSPSIRYIDLTETGEIRARGIFGEPSQLAIFSIVAIVYLVSYGMAQRGAKRAGSLSLAVVAFLNLVASAAGTAVVGGLLVAAVLLSVGVFRFLFRRAKLHPVLLLLGLAGVVIALFYAPARVAALQAFLSDRSGSSSWYFRLESIRFSFGVMADTWFIGAGLGSNRPTSFIPLLLSCVGVVGAVLFVAAATALVRAAFKVPEYRPTAWALVAFFSVKLLVGGTLDDEVMWLCLAICAHAAWRDPQSRVDRATTFDTANSGVSTSLARPV